MNHINLYRNILVKYNIINIEIGIYKILNFN